MKPGWRSTRHSFLAIAAVMAALAVGGSGLVASALAASDALRARDGPAPETTQSVPHVQIGAQAVPELSQRLTERVAALPGVTIRPTVISLPGASGFWLSETLALARPQAIVGGREFAHLHPDGSLHASLPPERAREAVAAGWAVMHPWSSQRAGWEGFVLLFTPRSAAEADIVFSLIVDGYNYVTGANHVADKP